MNRSNEALARVALCQLASARNTLQRMELPDVEVGKDTHNYVVGLVSVYACVAENYLKLALIKEDT